MHTLTLSYLLSVSLPVSTLPPSYGLFEGGENGERAEGLDGEQVHRVGYIDIVGESGG